MPICWLKLAILRTNQIANFNLTKLSLIIYQRMFLFLLMAVYKLSFNLRFTLVISQQLIKNLFRLLQW